MPDFVTVLDIGTSTVRALSAELNDGDQLHVLGVATAASQGVKRGFVDDPVAASTPVAEVLKSIEAQVGRDSSRLIVGVGGLHLDGVTHQGLKPIVPRGRTVTHQDVLEVVNHSRSIAPSAEKVEIQALPIEFKIDGNSRIRKPIGNPAAKLEVITYIGTARKADIEKLEKLLSIVDRAVEPFVLSPLAAGVGALEQSEMDEGAVVVDIGAGTTDVAIFINGSLAFVSSLPACASHVTNDISALLKTTPEEAERLKIAHGCALSSAVGANESVEVLQFDHDEARPLQRKILAEIIESRMREIAKMVLKQIEKSGRIHEISGGVVLTGGGCELYATDKLFAETLGIEKVRRAKFYGEVGDTFGGGGAVSTGLARFALQCYDDLAPATGAAWKDRVRSLFSMISGR